MEEQPAGPSVVLGAVMHRCETAEQTPIVATFKYLIEDSIAVHATFRGSVNETTWRFGRDLLEAAFATPDSIQGLGDVQVCYLSEHQMVRITLTNGADQVHVFVDSPPVWLFTEKIYTLVPFGHDRADVDAMLEALEVDQ